MEIIERKENPLLNRVEIEFRWNHEGSPTPSRMDMLNSIASIEPGSKRDLIVIKKCQHQIWYVLYHRIRTCLRR